MKEATKDRIVSLFVGGLLLYVFMIVVTMVGLPWGLRVINAESHLEGLRFRDYYALAAPLWIFVVGAGFLLHIMFGPRKIVRDWDTDGGTDWDTDWDDLDGDL